MDIERGNIGSFHNDVVRTFSWKGCTVRVQGKKSGGGKTIIDSVEGVASAGELVALMGPSGSGKTTLLNLLAGRVVGKNVKTSGDVLVDGAPCSRSTFRTISSYVEQEDALIGSLTARETVDFCARLSQSRITSPALRRKLVTDLLAAFGLSSCADLIIGTPLRKGISGGQKRRVSVAAQLVTGPSILFLDEPTSGLDSQASFEVVSYLREIARKLDLIVIASIHQPSTATFNLFDKLCLLGSGQTCYFGNVTEVVPYFANIGHSMPAYTNPAEYLLDLINTDFAEGKDADASKQRVDEMKSAWAASFQRMELLAAVPAGGKKDEMSAQPHAETDAAPAAHSASFASVLLTLLHRSFVKSYRDVLVFGVRLIMYLGLAVLMGTVWVRMDATQEYIQPFINAIFFGSAFMSFMAVAYIPAYIEDYNAFRKDRANGLYGPLAFQLANFLIAIPYLFIIALVFSLVSYWLSGFENTGRAFFTWVLFLFLDLLAAEGLVILISSLFPVFVVALALTAFANGAWMATGGFLVPLGQLNPFYKYVFHYINYQAYVFQGMMVNEFHARSYACGAGCDCSYPTLGLQCRIPGVSVLQRYSYRTDKQGEWIGILVVIIFVYRLLALGAVSLRKH